MIVVCYQGFRHILFSLMGQSFYYLIYIESPHIFLDFEYNYIFSIIIFTHS